MPRDYNYAYTNLQKSLSEFKNQVALMKEKVDDKAACDAILAKELNGFKNIKEFWSQVSSLKSSFENELHYFKECKDRIDSARITSDNQPIFLSEIMLGRITQDTQFLLRGCSYEALIYAIEADDIEFAQNILVSYPDIVHSTDEDGWYPIHHCANSGTRKMLDLLIEKGSDVDAKTEYSYTPLHIALRNGNAECVIGLLNNNADSELKDRGGDGSIDFLKEGFPDTTPIIERYSEEDGVCLHLNNGHLAIVIGGIKELLLDEYLG